MKKNTRFPDFNDLDVVEEALNIIRLKLKAIDIIKKTYVGEDKSFCKKKLGKM